MGDAQARRRAENEVSARRINEKIEAEGGGVEAAPAFVCECSREDCRLLIKLSSQAYELVRADPRRFVVVAAHVFSEIERVVETHPAYVVVEKHGDAGQLAEDRNPRP